MMSCYKGYFSLKRGLLRPDIKSGLAMTLLAVIFSASLVFAGIGVEPKVLELKLKPGKSKKGYLYVVSDFSENVKVIVQPEDYWEKQTGKKGLDVGQWLKIKPKEFILQPNSFRKVYYKVKLPKDVDSENMAMVFFATRNPGGGSLGIITRFGVAFYLLPEGKEEIIAKIGKITPGWRIKEKNQFQFTINVENLGNVHLRPKGKVEIKDSQGQTAGEAELVYGWPVFPGRSYNYFAVWERKEEKFLPGKYTATAVLDCGEIYGYKDKIYQQQVEFGIDTEGNVAVE